jgi:hypothetical protein
MRFLLAFLGPPPAVAAFALRRVTVIVYIMFGRPAPARAGPLHFDSASAARTRCPAVTKLWDVRGRPTVYLLLGGLVLGVATGLAAAAY